MKKPIDIVEKVMINGIEQKIHVIGTDINNPLILFIHGGPGVVNRHNVSKYMSGITDKVTIVGWDQRGTGGSYKGAKKEDMNVDTFVEDARELTEYLCKKFNKDKIYIQGHSWGSCVGTLLAYKYPENIKAYFGQGQLVNGIKNEEMSYDYVMEKAKAAGDEKDVQKLLEIKRPVKGLYVNNPIKDLTAQRQLLNKYGGAAVKCSSMWKSTISPILFSSEYSLSDIIGVLKGYSFSLKHMWEEVVKLDFAKDCTRFSIPLFYLIGSSDYNTPFELSYEYYNSIEAPMKDYIWFKESAHSPLAEEPDKFGKTLVEKIELIEAM